MDVNEKASVKVTAKPSAAGKNAVFKSSNSAVASVSKKGVVTARKAGAANITVTVSSKDEVKSWDYHTGETQRCALGVFGVGAYFHFAFELAFASGRIEVNGDIT